MGTVVWRGDADEVAEVKSVTPANVEATDIFTLTINGKSISYTAAANTVADVTAGLEALWNASTINEFEEITASDETTYLKLTHDTAGIPFTVTSSTTDGGGNNTQTLTVNTTTSASGPHCVNVITNWSGGSLPANSDDVVFEYSDVDALYGLDALTGLVLNSITVRQSFTGAIGLPRMNANDYLEYRTTSLTTGFNTCNIGIGDGSGSGRVRIDAENTDSTVNIYNSGDSLESYIPTILLKNLGANTICNVYKGDVGVAFLAGETASIATLRLGYISNIASDAIVTCGSGTTLTTVTKNGGDLDIRSNVTTLTQDAGTTTIGGSATATTINLNGGTLYDQSSGTFTTVNILAAAVFNLQTSLAAKTITNLNMYRNSSFLDPQGMATVTNGLDLVQCNLENVTIARPPNRTWTETAI